MFLDLGSTDASPLDSTVDAPTTTTLEDSSRTTLLESMALEVLADNQRAIPLALRACAALSAYPSSSPPVRPHRHRGAMTMHRPEMAYHPICHPLQSPSHRSAEFLELLHSDQRAVPERQYTPSAEFRIAAAAGCRRSETDQRLETRCSTSDSLSAIIKYHIRQT